MAPALPQLPVLVVGTVPVLVGSVVRFHRLLGFSFIAGLPYVPGWSLAISANASFDMIQFVIWPPVLVVGGAPVGVGSVPGLVVWMFAPLDVELRCLPRPWTPLAVVLALAWSWYVSFPGEFGYHVCSPVSSLTSGEVGFLVDHRVVGGSLS